MTMKIPPLMGEFVHECPDWDYLEIDENDEEFAHCSCAFGKQGSAERFRAQDAQKRQIEKIDGLMAAAEFDPYDPF